MIVRESPKRDLARLIIWYPVRWLIRFMPVATAFRFFRFLGKLHCRLAKNRLDHLRTSVQRADYSEQETDDIIETYLENHYIDRLHIFTYPRLLKSRELYTICRIDGLDHLNSALERGHGAIITLGHAGPIQLPLFHLGHSGYSVIQIGLPTDEGLSWIGRKVAFRLRLKYEAMIPVKILPANRFLRPLFKHLRKDGVVMMNIDPAGGGRWIGRMIRLPFLGASIPFPMGSAFLSVKTGAPVLPLSIHSQPDGSWMCRLHSAMEPVKAGEEAAWVAKLARWYETQIRREPGLWHFWDEFEPGKLIESLNAPVKNT